MKITEVSASVSFTKNLGNYQSLRAEASITSEVEAGEIVEDIFKKIFGMAKEQVREQTKPSGQSAQKPNLELLKGE